MTTRKESLATTEADFFKTLLDRQEETQKHLNELSAQLNRAADIMTQDRSKSRVALPRTACVVAGSATAVHETFVMRLCNLPFRRVVVRRPPEASGKEAATPDR